MADHVNCKYCGTDVVWHVSKAGHKYLAQVTPIFGETGRQIKTIYPAHKCTADAAQRAIVDEQLRHERDTAIANGEIVIGQRVVVAKGRKFPIGVTGTIDWVAREADGYGVVKVRVVKDDGDKFYINKANLEVAA